MKLGLLAIAVVVFVVAAVLKSFVAAGIGFVLLVPLFFLRDKTPY